MELNVGDGCHQHTDPCLASITTFCLMRINSWREKDGGTDIRFSAWNFVTNLPFLLWFTEKWGTSLRSLCKAFPGFTNCLRKRIEWSNVAKHLSCQDWFRLDLKAFRSHDCVVEELIFPHSCHFIPSQYCQRHPCLVTALNEELTTSFDSFPWALLTTHDYRFLLSLLVWIK